MSTADRSNLLFSSREQRGARQSPTQPPERERRGSHQLQLQVIGSALTSGLTVGGQPSADAIIKTLNINKHFIWIYVTLLRVQLIQPAWINSDCLRCVWVLDYIIICLNVTIIRKLLSNKFNILGFVSSAGSEGGSFSVFTSCFQSQVSFSSPFTDSPTVHYPVQ